MKEKDFSKEANEEMRLYNLTMKVNRLEMLKANIGLELISGHDELQKFMGKILKGRTEDELKRQAGILGETIQNNAKLADSIVNASFHNATFSDRIWMYQGILKDDLDGLLQRGLIGGKSSRALAKDLKDRFGVRRSDAERLMRKELARVQTEEWDKHGKAEWKDAKKVEKPAKKSGGSIENSVNGSTIKLGRKTVNKGAFFKLPERMSKKHIRDIAKECGIDIHGLKLNIDYNEELLRIPYAGCADTENVGQITFFPNAFKSREELIRTLYHEKIHVEQFKEHGVEHVQNNREHFEELAYAAEDEYIARLKKEGVL